MAGKVTTLRTTFRYPVSTTVRLELYGVGTGGWVRYEDDELNRPVFVRYAIDPDRDRLIAVDVVLTSGDGAVDTDALRRVPLGRIDAFANSPTTAKKLRAGRIAFDDGAKFRADLEKRVPRPKNGPRQPEVDAKLPPTPAKPYGDDFYRAVATVYSEVAKVRSDPGAAIADANGENVTTIHRWVKVARQRGFLPATMRGKAF